MDTYNKNSDNANKYKQDCDEKLDKLSKILGDSKDEYKLDKVNPELSVENKVYLIFDSFFEYINSMNSANSANSLGEGSENEKNQIWNYTLLDSSTNREYGNHIFPVKRKFVIDKAEGYKDKFIIDKYHVMKELVEEPAFVPICTRKVFSKEYTQYPENMLGWTKKDAEAYLEDMQAKWDSFVKKLADLKQTIEQEHLWKK